MPNIKAMEEYNLTHREKRVILDEVKGLKVSQKINTPSKKNFNPTHFLCQAVE